MPNPVDTTKIFPLTTLAGVKRDGTTLESNYYNDSLWCRFQRGKPRKIGGYRELADDFSGPSRGMFMESQNGLNYVYSGASATLEVFTMDQTGAGGGIIDRTPAGFSSSDNNLWQFDSLYDAGGTTKVVVAHAGQNLSAIDSTVQTPIYYGAATGTTTFTTTGTSVSGGVFSMPPYLVALDNDGYVMWSPPNTLAFTGTGSGNARIAGNKLIKGMRTRGGSGYSPAGIVWSLDELYRMYFVGGAAIFNFDYIADTSLISSSCPVEYNGRIYWPDLNRFCVFNGAVEDLPNDMNTNYFYDNVNLSSRQKIWGTKVPHFHEIWWFWPKGNATECTDVIVYNVKENTWYDTAWAKDQLARSAGVYSKVFSYPIMMGLNPDDADKYKLWQHEFGVDRIENNISNAIRSYFETNDISFAAEIAEGGWIGDDRWVQLMRVEPDFVQTGQMELYITGNPYAASEPVTSGPYVFTSSTGKIDLKEQRRELRLRFESNVQGGNYQLGQTLIHVEQGDGRQ